MNPDDIGQHIFTFISSETFPFLGYRGYKEELLQKPLSKKERPYVICPVCKGLLRNAVMDESQTVTCKACSLGKNAKPLYVMRDSVENNKGKCPFSDCNWIGELQNLEYHVTYCCECLPKQCPIKHCYKMVKGKEWEAHQKKCPKLEVICGRCRRRGELGRLENHEKYECPKFHVECPNMCGEKLLRADFEKHNRYECANFEQKCCVRENSSLRCSEFNPEFSRKQLDKHNREEFITHINMLERKVRDIEDRLLKSEHRLTIKQDLDGCEWRFNQPEFYVQGYKLKLTNPPDDDDDDDRHPCDDFLKFIIERIPGEHDNTLGEAYITEARMEIINTETPANSYTEVFGLGYKLEIGVVSESFGSFWYNGENLRFYFVVNKSPKLHLKDIYEKTDLTF